MTILPPFLSLHILCPAGLLFPLFLPQDTVNALSDFLGLFVLMGGLLYTFFLVGGVMQYLGGGPSELFPDGYAVSFGLVQHPAGILPETGGDSIRLPALEEQQVLVRPGLVKGIIHVPLPGQSVKFLWGPGELDAVGRRAVGHQLFHGLPAVGRLVGPAFLLYLPASRLEHIGQPPGRQLSRPYRTEKAGARTENRP